MVCTALVYQTCAHRYPVPQSPHQGEGRSQHFDYMQAWLTFISTYPENCTHDKYALTSPSLLSSYAFQLTPTMHNLLASGPDLQVYGLAMPLHFIAQVQDLNLVLRPCWYTNMATVPLFLYTKATATRTAKQQQAQISKITTVGIAYFLLPSHDDEQKLSNFTQFYGVREQKTTIFFLFSLTEI